MLRTPVSLQSGDTIGLIGTSSPTPPHRIEPAVKALESYGLRVVVGESCYASYGYLSGKDEVRANDVNRMFGEQSIKGIFAIRGGYGSARMLPYLDFDLIKRNPKVFVGYSDVTALHLMFNQLCNFVTYHAPMPSTEFTKGIDAYTEGHYIQALFSRERVWELKNPPHQEMNVWKEGSARGSLTGGNLSLVAASIGTPYEIDTKGKIIFLEDIDEAPHRLDRMLTQLKQAGKFRDANGVILGAFTNCEGKEQSKSLSFVEIIADVLEGIDVPVLYDVACGHILPTMTLPLGAIVEMNTEHKSIIVRR